MATKSRKKLSQSKLAIRKRNVAQQSKLAEAQRKRAIKLAPQRKELAHKQRLYTNLVKDFAAKQKQKGVKMTYQQAQRSEKFKYDVFDKLKQGARYRKSGNVAYGNQLIKEALEETTRRDDVQEWVVPGESAQFTREAA